MLLVFPNNTLAIVCMPYQRPYDNPISLKAGEQVLIDPVKTQETDILGWAWCTGPDGRQGWVPTAWLEHDDGAVQVTRDFSALELTLQVGDRVTLHHSESGFVWVTHENGATGWVPDACLQRVNPKAEVL
ncbi:MAG: SH3 domain-containing protein [Rubrivivax sp.]|jgi:hypothetical protein|nr:hypothetical protein [Rubrivivax sp.]